MTKNAIVLDGLSKRFGSTDVIRNLSASIAEREFIVVLGSSGCGKSTLLNVIAGLERLSGGRILVDGQEVQDREPKDRGCAMVFQNYALYPHMSVADNIGYALKVAGVPVPERRKRIEAAARTVNLGDFLERRPSELSGGQRQRVAIARAIVREPKVLLFDEPLSNLDAKLRYDTRMELAQLHRRIGATSIFVTHDQVEAMTLADRVMLLNAGRIEQFAPPHELYNRPCSTFVAGFIGSPAMNLFAASGDGQMLRLLDGTAIARHGHKGEVVVGIRPEKIIADDDGIPAVVRHHEDLGSHAVFSVNFLSGQKAVFSTSLGANTVAPAAELRLRLPSQHLHLFDSQTGRRFEN
nr:sn-glycerol-3-phosphate ABC transporter ATP-binding protein UgpC [Rhizobium etli]